MHILNFIGPWDDLKSPQRLCSWMPKRLADRVRIDDFSSFLGRERYEPGIVVVGNCDLVKPSTRREFEYVCRALHTKAPDIRIFNQPGFAKDRYEFLKTLKRNGINDFDVFRPDEFLTASVCYPVFIREEYAHTGSQSGLLESREAVLEALASIRRSNWHRQTPDLLIVEFCETRSEDGVYRKFGAFRFGATILAKEISYGNEWMVKFDPLQYLDADMKQIRYDRLEEDQKFIDENPHEDWIRSVFNLAGIEYGRLDYALKEDGRLQSWEINTHPSYGAATKVYKTDIQVALGKLRVPRRMAFNRRFFEAMMNEIENDRTASVTKIDIPVELTKARKKEDRIDKLVRWTVQPLRHFVRWLRRLRD